MCFVYFKKFLLLCLFIFFVSCVSKSNNYPAIWWENVATESKKSWEILPSSVAFPEVILSKRNELGILSNFAPTSFVFESKEFSSLEGFWQATKFPENSKDPRFRLAKWPYSRQQVEKLTGFEAKRAGDFASLVMKKNKIDWVSFNGKKMIYKKAGESEFYHLIFSATQEKVKQNPMVKEILIRTKGLKLRPDHVQESDLPLAWQYYKIYEKIREEL